MVLSPGTAVALVAAAAAATFAGAWVRQLRTRDATSVDLLWTLGIATAASFHAWVAEGWLPRRVFVTLLVWVWASRLTWHLWKRLGRGEDSRYAQLRLRAAGQAPAWFLIVYATQAALVVLLALTFVPLVRSAEIGWRFSDGLATLVFCIALLGETLADNQLQRWRENPANDKSTCRQGLWRYSRHPNYFFEWLHWFAYPLLGIGLNNGALLWLTPLAMFLLMRYVSGVPPSEAQALRKRGPDYRSYQKTTNAFFPGPPLMDGAKNL